MTEKSAWAYLWGMDLSVEALCAEKYYILENLNNFFCPLSKVYDCETT